MATRSLRLLTLVGVLWPSAALPHAALQSFNVTSTPSSGVFSTIGTPSTPDAGHTTWPVTMNMALLSTLPSSVVLNFPDRASATLTRMRTEARGPGAFLWTGHGAGCSALFSAAPINFRGVISCMNAPYAVEEVGGTLELTRSNPAPGATGTWEPPPPNFGTTRTPSTDTTPCGTPFPTTDSAIEILVLYNESVRQAIDGTSNTNTAATVKFMHDAVDTTQLALDNSTTNFGQPGVQPIAQVAFLGGQEVTEADEGDATAALTYVTNNAEPAAFRAFYGADVVVYVFENGGGSYLGVSNEPNYNGTLPYPGHDFAKYAESVVQRNRAISDTAEPNPAFQEPYVFPHEFAHELGANHNVEVGDNSTPLTSYAYGKWAAHPASEGGGERTIMSYLYPSCTAPCTRILNYSNPGVQEDWFVTGGSAANNALILQTYANTTAQYCASLSRIFANAFEDRFHKP